MMKKIINSSIFIFWKTIHRLPKELVEIWQIREFNNITQHAYTNSSLYFELYKNITPFKVTKKTDIENFPITNKKTFLGIPAEKFLCLDKYRPYYHNHSSGSTGEPFSFFSTRDWRSPYHTFLTLRFLFWKKLPLKKIVKVPLANLDINHNAGTHYGSRKEFSAYDIETNPKKILKELAEYCPIIIDSFPSFLIDLAKIVKKFPHLKPPSLKYVISKGENLTPSNRKFIESSLCCEIYDRYGMEEFGVIGVECRYHDGFHINNESFLLEIVDKCSKNVPTGVHGRVIITDFRNYVMPFIRYDTGDRGYFLAEPCKCGVPGYRLKLKGRDAEFLNLQHKKIHYFDFYDIMKFYSNVILQYQVVHTDKHTITLFIVPITKISDQIINLILKKIKKLIGENYELEIKNVPHINKTPRGKIKTIVNLKNNYPHNPPIKK